MLWVIATGPSLLRMAWFFHVSKFILMSNKMEQENHAGGYLRTCEISPKHAKIIAPVSLFLRYYTTAQQ